VGSIPHSVACETSWAFAAFTASRSTRPSDSGLETASELNNEPEFGIEFGPSKAFAGVAPISPANNAKLIKKSPDLFTPRKILTSPIYFSLNEDLAHPITRTTQESMVR
jgi:hypothetical protein